MVQITVPQIIAENLTNVDMRLGRPQQSVLRSPWTGAAQVLNRGYDRWSGVASVRRFARPDTADWQIIEAFFAQLGGAANTFDLPHFRTPAPIAANTIFQSSKTDDTGALAGILQHRFNSGQRGIAVGQMIQAGDRTFRITQLLPQRWVVLYPQRPIPNTDALTGSTTVRARARGSDGVTSPMVGSWVGPWTIEWEQA